MADAAAAATASAGTETRGQPATGDEQEEHLLIRHMRPDELKQAMDIWKERGLKASENSVSTFYQVDPEGFFVTVDTRTGEPSAEASFLGRFRRSTTQFGRCNGGNSSAMEARRRPDARQSGGDTCLSIGVAEGVVDREGAACRLVHDVGKPVAFGHFRVESGAS
ncbi:hypothetical protein HPB49_023797 [Dermacentor silvarum]|uniref:Uncharacterized protein n=1 Tax=Dermacentor silvarum TaxID=543639 RepID=A0ACB8D8W0_DERSI|nr:hypothetical protein HPB49_023797 [Dermacentor silvarum]